MKIYATENGLLDLYLYELSMDDLIKASNYTYSDYCDGKPIPVVGIKKQENGDIKIWDHMESNNYRNFVFFEIEDIKQNCRKCSHLICI